MRIIATDVLVIGAGGAGCRAAIAAADKGASVLLVFKRQLGNSGATSYPVAEMAGYNAGDLSVPGDIEAHYNDIVSAGRGMTLEPLARILAENAPQTITQLESWGVQFEHENNDYYVFKSCFSNKPRTHVIKGHGEPIIRAMKHQISIRDNISLLENFTVFGLLMKDNECVGAYGMSEEELTIIQSNAVILSTGGCGTAFKMNMNPPDVTGTGYALAFHAGADLINMEFMQIGLGYSWPVVNIFNGYIWETKPILTDGLGQSVFTDLPNGISPDLVMHEHRKHFPFSSSDNSKYLELAIHTAIQSGRASQHGGITVDFSHVTDEYVNSLVDDCGIHHMWPIARDYLLSKGVDLQRDRPEVSCFAHAINGGILINQDSESTIAGLFAAGECAGGPHGADRLGGNMMVTCQVFGKIAGEKAAERALHHKVPFDVWKDCKDDIHFMMSLLRKKYDSRSVLDKLQSLTQKNLLVGRTEEGLSKVIRFVDEHLVELEKSPEESISRFENIDLYHMLSTIKIIAFAALNRRESRGSHHRADYPEENPSYMQPHILNKKSVYSF